MANVRVNKDGSQSAQINYTGVDVKQRLKPLSKEVKEDLKDLNETGTKFDLDDDNGIT